MRKYLCSSCPLIALAIVVALFVASPASAQGCQNPPEPTLDCGAGCGTPNVATCTDGGFTLTLTGYEPAPNSMSGGGTYTYQICNPAAGVCTGTARPGESCLDNTFCQSQGQDTDPSATCTRQCAIDNFRGLSHLDVDFPSLGTCLSETNFVGGTCACVGNAPGCSVSPNVVIGDGSCFCSSSSVAKCDNTTLPVGACIEMALTISGETNVLGLGKAVVVDKDANTCFETCVAGPTCVPPEDCDDGVDNDCDGLTDCFDPDCAAADNCGDGGGECLTHTLGFWGTHPWITNNYGPVTVCGHTVGCDGASDGESNPSCEYGHCNDIMEALGSNSSELKNAGAYIALIRQLAAAKLNLAATAQIVEGANCSGWTYGGKTIQGWIEACEAVNLCNGSQSKISNSGCIEALNAFNNSADSGFDQPPAPFDRPPLDDFGNISGADSSGFTGAGHSGIVVGKQACTNQ